MRRERDGPVGLINDGKADGTPRESTNVMKVYYGGRKGVSEEKRGRGGKGGGCPGFILKPTLLLGEGSHL
jgi:hypothetical protein